ncbi:hypothetical protein DFR29_1212 [Tahibacter aquaticus]|uniref:Uncharacterized protein n=1 Tax=Tahibacter aquaticus TaxID=520092 RepID=A0A4R6YM26_9GAMM|nr:hypothetical protein [Tahibacter aquaticus]TDR38330.1 hypothetical protein DFR29_1212 [Tahibacter aquaticus]
MNALDAFEARVIKALPRLFREFGMARIYSETVDLALEVADRLRLNSMPHDHVVSARVDLSRRYAFVQAVKIEEAGFTVEPDGVSGAALVTETDTFTLELETAEPRRHDAQVVLSGVLRGGTDLEAELLRCIARLRILGLQKKHLPAEFYKETAVEARAFATDGRTKQALFAYVTAIDSLINHALRDLTMYEELREPVSRLKLMDKFHLMLKRAVQRDVLRDEPLVSRLASTLEALLEQRNRIAHSIARTQATRQQVRQAVFVLLTLMMIGAQGSVAVPTLTAAYTLMPARTPRTPSR